METNRTTTLEDLGWSPGTADDAEENGDDGRQTARVVAVDRDSFVVHGESGRMRAEMSGRLAFSARSPLDLPVVGDWVRIQPLDADRFAIIHGVLPRRSLLKRKTAGRRIDYQAIAANIDTALLVQALDGDFSLPRLERYLVMVNEAGIAPLVVLSKSDLLTAGELARRCALVRRRLPKVALLAVSHHDGTGIDALTDRLSPGLTFCLLGSSGVGKTTLLNRLLDGGQLATAPVRAGDGKGRHTTSRRRLLVLPGGALVIDTPGMRELGNLAADDGLDRTFEEITVLAAACRYGDCTHTGEQGCAVQAAVNTGRLPADRLANYRKMTREAAHLERSYLEKRRRDKQFGKMVKTVMKIKNNR